MQELYPNDPRCLIVLFNSGHPGARERLQREVDAWRGSAHIEKLEEGHSALIIQPGGATRLTS